MIEVRVLDAVLGVLVMCFDGRVLEFFSEGPLTPTRLHVAMLSVNISEPDRKGRHQLDFVTTSSGHNGVRMILDDHGRTTIEPLLRALLAAIASAPPTLRG